jgi:hypothetical protein
VPAKPVRHFDDTATFRALDAAAKKAVKGKRRKPGAACPREGAAGAHASSIRTKARRAERLGLLPPGHGEAIFGVFNSGGGPASCDATGCDVMIAKLRSGLGKGRGHR